MMHLMNVNKTHPQNGHLCTVFTNTDAYVIGHADARDSKSPCCQHVAATADHGSALPRLSVVLQGKVSYMQLTHKNRHNKMIEF